jgi:hypothetical protein
VVCLVGDVSKLRPAAKGMGFLVAVGALLRSEVLRRLEKRSVQEACSLALDEVRMELRRMLSSTFGDDRWMKGDPSIGFVFGMVDDEERVKDGGLFFSVQMFRFGRSKDGLSEKFLRVNELDVREEQAARAKYGMEPMSDDGDESE